MEEASDSSTENSRKRKIEKIHHDMKCKLAFEHLDNESAKKFRFASSYHLSHADKGNLTEPFEIMDRLEATGHLAPGRYDVVREIGDKIKERNLASAINDAERQIKNIQQSEDYVNANGDRHLLETAQTLTTEHEINQAKEEKVRQCHKEEWFPFPSKVAFLMYIFMNSTTHPVSEEVVKFVLHMLRQLGVADVPTIGQLKCMRFGSCDWNSMLSTELDPFGTPVSIVKPSEILKLLIAHPKVSQTLIRHPRKGDGIDHPAGAEKWMNEIPASSANYSGKTVHTRCFYQYLFRGSSHIGLVEKFTDNLQTDAIEVTVSEVLRPDDPQLSRFNCTANSLILTHNRTTVPLKMFVHNHQELSMDIIKLYKLHRNTLHALSNEDYPSRQSLPVVSMPINLFLDDTSTNRSRRWLALHCIQMQLAGLPLCERQRQGSIFFVGASEKTDIMDIMHLVRQDISLCESDGIESFDAATGQPCLVQSMCDVVIADTAMLSYCCNHFGATAVKFCPRCYSTACQFQSKIGERNPSDTQRTVNRINMRCNEADKKRLRKLRGVKEHKNYLWDVIDPHRDIPVGQLHLLPLGISKQVVKFIVSQVSDTQLQRMACHLEANLSAGSTLDRSFFTYLDSRQGKDFKCYLQIAPFNMSFADIPQYYLDIICCLATIQKQMNAVSFRESDLSDLEDKIQHLHAQFSRYMPQFAKKLKCHLLLHAIDDIRRHGPPSSYVEDAFEKNHGAIRNQIFLENQKARSRDTAVRYAKHIVCQHIVTGGYFKIDEEWMQASVNVIDLSNVPAVSSFLGIKEAKTSTTPGAISKISRNGNSHPIQFQKSEVTALNTTEVPLDCTIQRGSAVYAQNSDLVNKDGWVIYCDSDGNECYGIFKEGFIITSSSRGHVEKKLAAVLKAKDTEREEMGCPILELTDEIAIISTKDVLSRGNIVHHCREAHCTIKSARLPVVVEQRKTTQDTTFLSHHNDKKIYVLNKFKI